MRIEKIYVAEDLPDEKTGKQKEVLDYAFMNTDVIVQLEDKKKYRANFITLRKLANEFDKHQKRIEDNSKTYFWSKNMVIVDNMQKKDLRPMIEYMIDEGDFQMIFEKL